MSDAAPLITFLSDYGHGDEFVGVCHAVIARRTPRARIIDLGHGVARHDIRAGALALRAALPYTPPGVHLAVVDPGVGGPRRAVALRLQHEGRTMVGPDNGLLTLAAQTLGGVLEAVDIANSPEALQPRSATFDGRDLFAPVAAALADGAPLDALGEPIDPATLAALALPQPSISDGALRAHALSIDSFGNVSLDATAELAEHAGLVLGGGLRVQAAGDSRPALLARAFGDVAVGELLVYVDSRGALALAINGGSAALSLGLAPDDEVVLRRP
jgi:S-adenosylmethionine hydrolase